MKNISHLTEEELKIELIKALQKVKELREIITYLSKKV